MRIFFRKVFLGIILSFPAYAYADSDYNIGTMHNMVEETLGNNYNSTKINIPTVHYMNLYHDTNDTKHKEWNNTTKITFITGYDKSGNPQYDTEEQGIKIEIFNANEEPNPNKVSWNERYFLLQDMMDSEGRPYQVMVNDHKENGDFEYPNNKRIQIITDNYDTPILKIIQENIKDDANGK